MPKIDLAGIPQKIVNVHAGKPIILIIPISGKPAPTCSWFFSGVQMKDKLDRIKIETTVKSTKLTVRETSLEDTGNYTLEVKNVVGIATEIVKVIILGKLWFVIIIFIQREMLHMYNRILFELTKCIFFCR